MKTLVSLLWIAVLAVPSWACTNFIVGKNASVTGSTMISYAADSHQLYGELYYTPAADHPEGAMRPIIDWDTQRPLGQIPEVPHTYRVVGNVNEYQVTVAESTWGGDLSLMDSTGIIDYGSLIYIALERSKTAREAIDVMTSLVAEYGYASEGETFSIGDPNEVWVMDLIGKGPGNKGAVWVARRIPDDCIAGHANQARIHTFPQSRKLNKKLNRYEVGDSCLYSADVITLARQKGKFTGADRDFDFCRAYADQDFGAFRGCDGRVWAFFNHFKSGMDKYFPFVNYDCTLNCPQDSVLPLYVRPDRKLSHRDVQAAMRDHFEGTPWDMTQDVGGGPFHSAYRWRPMHFEVDGQKYTHERAVATQQTGFVFVSEMRGWLPREVGAKTWFAVDDANTAVFTPVYNNILEAPECFRVGNGDILTFSWTSAFWMNNWVAQQVYTRYEPMMADVRLVRDAFEDRFDAQQDSVDRRALDLLKTSSSAVTAFLNGYSSAEANAVTSRYKELALYLLVKYMDGNVKKEVEGQPGNFKRTPYGVCEFPLQPAYSEDFLRAIVDQHGDVIRVK
jgi:dipeptidase